MDIREPILYDGLKISIIPEERKEIFLTGESPSFKVRVENPDNRGRRGALIFTWHLGQEMTVSALVFKLASGQQREYELPREWLAAPGRAVYYIGNIGDLYTPERILEYLERGEKSLEEGTFHFLPSRRELPKIQSSAFHTLCQYRVEDRATVEYEKERREEEREHAKIQRDLATTQNRLTWVIAVFTVVTAILTILRITGFL